jgi:phosphatidylserine/phosphatidylglycerophosphate/cardiolipin synthase-like enzyme
MTSTVAPRRPVTTTGTGPASRTPTTTGPQTTAPATTAATTAPAATTATDRISQTPLRRAFDSAPARGVDTVTARVEVDNIGAWNARWELLAGATTRIDSTYFSLDKDAYGMAFLGHLLKKQREGVAVRFMMDGMADAAGLGFKVWGRDYLNQLVRDGAEVRVYHPVNTRFTRLLEGSGYAQNHDKILVVDGQRGITGGRNIGGAYFADPKDVPTAWRDTDVVLDGKGAAAGLVAAIDAEWNQPDNVSSAVGNGLWGNLQSREVELIGAYVLMDLWMHEAPLSPAKKQALRGDEKARTRLAEDLVKRAVARLPAEGVKAQPDWSEITILTELATELVNNLELAGGARRTPAPTRQGVDARIVDRTSARVDAHDDFADALIKTADSAQKRLLIQNPYVVLTKPMLEALERAAKRGVQITIVTNSPNSTDSAVTQAFFLRDWPEVMARLDGAKLFVFGGERKMHAKVAVADDDVSLVSTYNLDLLSSAVNGEVGSLMWSKEVASDVARSIEADLKDPANKIVEYTIARHPDGKAILEKGEPVVVRGPDSHVDADTMAQYRRAGAVADAARRFIPGLSALLLR